MKIKFTSAAIALFLAVFCLFSVSAHAQEQVITPTDQTGIVGEASDATTVPLENPDAPINDEIKALDSFEEAPQVDATRPAPNKETSQDKQAPLIGAAKPWQIGLPEAASPVKAEQSGFHDHILMVIISVITFFVMFLLLFVVVRFRRKRNPIPSTTSHNVKLEIIWTLVPLLILLVIVIPSMRLLYFSDRIADADMTIIATGYQWYWGYEYPDHDNISFLSYLIPENELKEGQLRLLETDNRVILPTNTNIRILVTAQDVLHSFAVPSLGLKTDAVPGRLNETWVRIEREGVYYGQCSELCGINHGFMPITIQAVSPEEFEQWLVSAREEFAAASTSTQYAYLGE